MKVLPVFPFFAGPHFFAGSAILSRFSFSSDPKLVYLSATCRILLVIGLLQLLSSSAAGQCHIIEYANHQRLLRVDGDYVLDYRTHKRLYKFDGEFLVSYPGYKRLLKMDGLYVVRYSDYRRIAKLDGDFLVNYGNYRRIARLECPGRRSAMAAAAFFLL